MKKKKSTTKSAKKSVSKSKPSLKKAVSSAPKANNRAGMMPLGDRVLVKPLTGETTTASGIIIPDTAKERPETGIVIAVGPGKRADNGSVIPVTVQVGDKVLFPKYGFTEVKVEGVEYYLINGSDILAVLN